MIDRVAVHRSEQPEGPAERGTSDRGIPAVGCSGEKLPNPQGVSLRPLEAREREVSDGRLRGRWWESKQNIGAASADPLPASHPPGGARALLARRRPARMGNPHSSSEPVVDERPKHKNEMKNQTIPATDPAVVLDLLRQAKRPGHYALIKGRSRSSSKTSWRFSKVTGIDAATGTIKIVEFKTLKLHRINAVKVLKAAPRLKRAAAPSDFVALLK